MHHALFLPIHLWLFSHIFLSPQRLYYIYIIHLFFCRWFAHLNSEFYSRMERHTSDCGGCVESSKPAAAAAAARERELKTKATKRRWKAHGNAWSESDPVAALYVQCTHTPAQFIFYIYLWRYIHRRDVEFLPIKRAEIKPWWRHRPKFSRALTYRRVIFFIIKIQWNQFSFCKF